MTSTKLRQLVLTSRPLSWVNTSYPFAAGYIVLTHRVSAVLIVGALYFLIPYNLLMYGVNDVFDYESDKRNPRKGGLEGAVVAKKNHRFILSGVLLVNIPFVITLLLLGNWKNAVVLTLVLFMVCAYSLPKLRFKERPFLDSFTSSCHFVGPLVYALSFTHVHLVELWILLAFFMWGMASHAFGAVQDIIADRAAHIGSIATVIGARATVWFSGLLYVLSAMVLAFRGWLGIICALTICLYALNVLSFRNVTDKSAEATNQGWKHFLKLNWLSGFIVTMMLIYIYRH